MHNLFLGAVVRMLDNLRAMAIFASVVNHGYFGGAAKEWHHNQWGQSANQSIEKRSGGGFVAPLYTKIQPN